MRKVVLQEFSSIDGMAAGPNKNYFYSCIHAGGLLYMTPI